MIFFLPDDHSENGEEDASFHDKELIQYVCDHVHIKPESILDFELFLYDLNVRLLLLFHA